MASSIISDFSSEFVCVFERSSIPENLQALCTMNDGDHLWTCLELLYTSTHSLGTALIEVKQATKAVKAAILQILKIVHESETGITDKIRHDLLVYVLSQVNRIPVSSVDGAQAILSMTKIPNYTTFYKMIKYESDQLRGRAKKTEPADEAGEPATSLEFFMDDEEG